MNGVTQSIPIAILAGQAAPPAVGPDFYVSPANGSDTTGTGSNGSPWATLGKAQTELQALLSGQSEDWTVHLLDDTAEAITLDDADSGQNGYVVNWIGPGANDCAEVVTGWTSYDRRRNIWVADYSGTPPRAIWVNNERCYRARRGSGLVGASLISTGYTVGADPILTTRNPEQVEVIYPVTFQEPRNKVSSISGSDILMIDPAHSYITDFPAFVYSYDGGFHHRTDKTPDDVENCWEDFIANAERGTFYHDVADDKLYYIPRWYEELAYCQVKVSDGTERPVQITGASSIRWKIKVRRAHWSMSQGFAERASNWHYDDVNVPSTNGSGDYGADGGLLTLVLPPAAITVTGCNDVLVIDGAVEHCTGMGVHVYANINCRLQQTRIHDISGNGYVIGDASEVDAVACSDGLDDYDNFISQVGREFKGSSGVKRIIATDSDLDHNTVEDCPYIGIQSAIGGLSNPDWTDKVSGGSVSYNRCRLVMKHTLDGGEFYWQNEFNGLSSVGNVGEGAKSDHPDQDTGDHPLIAGAYCDQNCNGVTIDDHISVGALQAFAQNGLPDPNTVTVGTIYSDTDEVFAENGADPNSGPTVVQSYDPIGDNPTIYMASGIRAPYNIALRGKSGRCRAIAGGTATATIS